MYNLGISCYYHDSAAALIKNGQVIGACEEERFTGIKHDSSFPINTINWLLTGLLSYLIDSTKLVKASGV